MVASLTELGNNSSSIQYGGTSTGIDLYPLLQNVDQWLRNDTYSGTATASSTTVTGVPGTSIFTTQLAAGATIMIGGQLRTVQSITSDSSLSVTSGFSPAITLPSAIKAINTTLTGTSAATTVRGTTNGSVSVTNGLATVTGTGTYFLAEATNAVATQTVNITTVAYDGAGNLTGTGSTWLTSQGGQNGLYPGDSIQIVGLGVTYHFVIATVTGDGAATVTSTSANYANVIPSNTVYTLYKAQNGVAGRTILINGRVRQITAINSNTSLTVNLAFDFSDSGLRWKNYPRGSVSNAIGNVVTGATGTSTSGTTLTIPTTASSLTGNIAIGCVANVVSGTGTIVPGTTIISQLTATGTANASPTRSDANASGFFITFSTVANILAGQFVASATGIAGNVYVANVNTVNNTVGLLVYGNVNASPVTAVNTSTATSFYTPGGSGTYVLSAAPTVALSAAGLQVSTIVGTSGSTNFAWDLANGDPVWIGDELRTFNFLSTPQGTLGNTLAGNVNIGYTTDITAVPYNFSGSSIGVIRQIYQTVLPRKEDSYINGTNTLFTTELRVGDELIIDGTEVFVSQIISTTQFKAREDFTHTLSTASTFYKKKKIHGYVLEGSREGGTTTTNVKMSGTVTMLNTVNTVYAVGSNSITFGATPAIGGATILYSPLKIPGAGGTPTLLTGQIISVTTGTVTGLGTAFTTQLHIGAEVLIGGRYAYVASIASDTSMTLTSNTSMTLYLNGAQLQIYRSVPLYTYAYSGTGAGPYLLGHTFKNTVYSQVDQFLQIFYPSTGADFIEYVYSAANKYTETSVTTFNTSLDRKYVGFRYFPMLQGTYAVPSSTVTVAGAFGGYSMPVYERWVASYDGFGGVPINQADLSGGTMVYGSQPTGTQFNQTANGLVCGSIVVPPATSQYSPFNFGIANNSPTALVNSAVNSSAATAYTTANSNTLGANTAYVPVIGSISGVFDIIYLTHTTGGYLYLFANPRYAIIQGKSFANVVTNFIGVVEYERAQPEDVGTGIGTSSLTYNAFTTTTGLGGAQTAQGMQAYSVYGVPNVAPWPTYGYVNGNRMPIGAGQYATLPVAQTAGIHGCVVSTPRVRNSAGDLVGVNANIYSALTITSGRWGHVVEMLATGAYQSPSNPSGNALVAQPVDSIPQIHMGQIVPVYTNVYNSKRFMFSPVVVLGPAYDPDVRGRIYGLKILPSALGAFMDTVSITVDSNYFYDTTFPASDHWVLTATQNTYRFTLRANTPQIQESWRSLEDSSTQVANINTTFTNNFRFALPT